MESFILRLLLKSKSSLRLQLFGRTLSGSPDYPVQIVETFHPNVDNACIILVLEFNLSNFNFNWLMGSFTKISSIFDVECSLEKWQNVTLFIPLRGDGKVRKQRVNILISNLMKIWHFVFTSSFLFLFQTWKILELDGICTLDNKLFIFNN